MWHVGPLGHRLPNYVIHLQSPLVSAVVAMALPGQAKRARAQAGFPTETLHAPRELVAIVQRDLLPPLAAAMRPLAKMGHSAC